MDATRDRGRGHVGKAGGGSQAGDQRHRVILDEPIKLRTWYLSASYGDSNMGGKIGICERPGWVGRFSEHLPHRLSKEILQNSVMPEFDALSSLDLVASANSSGSNHL